MSSDPIRPLFNILDLRKQGGAVSVVSIFAAVSWFVLQLPDEGLLRLKGAWWILAIPTGGILIWQMFNAYITEVKERTHVEKDINANLATLTANFERIFAHHLDDKMYLERRLDGIEDGLRTIFHGMEKRAGYAPGPKTEKFFAGGEG
jgi:hypothetical protein